MGNNILQSQANLKSQDSRLVVRPLHDLRSTPPALLILPFQYHHQYQNSPVTDGICKSDAWYCPYENNFICYRLTTEKQLGFGKMQPNIQKQAISKAQKKELHCADLDIVEVPPLGNYSANFTYEEPTHTNEQEALNNNDHTGCQTCMITWNMLLHTHITLKHSIFV